MSSMSSLNSINSSIADIIQTNFITGYRAYDVCHNKSSVVKIRAINNEKFDISGTNLNKIYYNEDTINGQKIPYIYGDINSFVKFQDILKLPKYSICVISKYNGTDITKKNKILTLENNINNKLTSIGHNNRWAGIVEYNNASLTVYKSSNKNNNNNWVVTCIAYNGINTNIAAGQAYIGSKDDPKGAIYTSFNDIEAVVGTLGINTNDNIKTHSEWALSHLLIWDNALSSEKLKIVYNTFIAYLSNPAIDDIILYKNNYPRNLLNCIEPFYTEPSINTNTINLNKPLWAGYYAGDYNSTTNVLPELLGNTSRNLTSNMLKNITLNNISAIPYIGGNKESYVIFPENSINSNFTICAITKYTSTIESNNNMILQSINNNDANLFYHGHYKNKNGVITYNNFEFSKGYPSTEPINSWIITCAKNANSPTIINNVIINDNYSGLYIEPEYINKTKNPTTLTINYNNDKNLSYNSFWALNYILIWDTHLSDTELKTISTVLNNYIKTGKKPIFINPTTPTTTTTTTTTTPTTTTPTTPTTTTPTTTISSAPITISSQYMGLNLTEMQKKMLL